VLTRESGAWVQSGATGLWYNTGESGWGWASYGGIYIDNGPYVDESGNAYPGDIQYKHDLEKLRLNWTRSVGAHQPLGDRRPAPQSDQDYPPKGPADWWDKTSRYYAPPGAEIILHGEAECPYIEIVRHDVRYDQGTETYYYWRDPNGVAISRDEPLWQYTPGAGGCTPSAAGQSFGIYDGNRAVFPFPPNGVIYAEGNIRVRGIMPPVRDNRGRIGTDIAVDDVYPGYFGEWAAVGGRSRRFDLQVVSGGTIYIEGDLLNPSSAHLGGLSPFGAVDDRIYYTNDSLYGSRVALLARDYVCVNTTALNPRPEDVLRPYAVQASDGTTTYQHYNDLQKILPQGYEPEGLWYGLFRPTLQADTNYNTNPRPAVPTDLPTGGPTNVQMLYTNSRLALWRIGLMPEVPDLRVMLGHSGVFLTSTEANAATDLPPADAEEVRVTLAVNEQTYPWGGASRYTFLQATTGSDQSDHWYNPLEDLLEFLPVGGVEEMPVLDYLQGQDTLTFSAEVVPVPNPDLTGWTIDPRQLGYLLGPVAIAPRNRTEAGEAVDPLPVEIDALIYAQNGSWFVLPGRWFNDDPDEFSPTGELPTSEYPGYHEPLNIKISVYGAISENMPADLGSVADWTSKWCGPAEHSQGFLSYVYDPLLRYPRRETRARIGYLRFPSFPITSDLVIWGERVSGAAGS
jgi:hypothetical protein